MCSSTAVALKMLQIYEQYLKDDEKGDGKLSQNKKRIHNCYDRTSKSLEMSS